MDGSRRLYVQMESTRPSNSLSLTLRQTSRSTPKPTIAANENGFLRVANLGNDWIG